MCLKTYAADHVLAATGFSESSHCLTCGILAQDVPRQLSLIIIHS